jgi:hypothetical protein
MTNTTIPNFEIIYDNIMNIMNIQNVKQVFLLLLVFFIIFGVERLYLYNASNYGAITYIPGVTAPPPSTQSPNVKTVANSRKKIKVKFTQK